MKFLFVATLCLSALFSGVNAEHKSKCKKLVHVCQDGVTKVYPNPWNECEFDLCPEDFDDGDYSSDDDEAEDDDTEMPVKATCKHISYLCSDGVTKVSPNPFNNCEFDLCPDEIEAEDLSIEDIIDVEETTPAPTPVPNSKDGKQVTATPTSAPKQVTWHVVSAESVLTPLREAVNSAFALYNSTQICDQLSIEYDSIERKNSTDMTDSDHKKHAKKHKQDALHSFHVVVSVDCSLKGEDQVSGKFILNMERHGKNEAQAYQLVECGHLGSWGDIVNWLAVRNNVGYCQTPTQKNKFDSQPLQYVNYHAKQLTMIDTIVRNKNYLAIVATIVGAIAVAIIVCVVICLRRRYCNYRKLNNKTLPPACAMDHDDKDIEIDVNVVLDLPKKKQPESEPEITAKQHQSNCLMRNVLS
ncbi:hypothetical protein THRCLA_06848 [Thraustotheca clavata]|uniref:Secreted protein n=1 Tax=Thraustotheca clavata TaxID=74557 RepID=A0A1V9ZIL2_9STRA|nr:hypothetical protein THRCLA_06848 [Thraustotheca clavata]